MYLKKSSTHYFIIFEWLLLCIFFELCVPSLSQGKEKALLQDIRLGSYTKYSRVVLDIDKHSAFKVFPEKVKNSITVILSDTALEKSKLRTKQFSDIRIQSIKVKSTKEGKTLLFIKYRNSNDAVYYFPLSDPFRLVIDIKERKEAIKLAGKTNPNPQKKIIEKKNEADEKRDEIKEVTKNENPVEKVNEQPAKESPDEKLVKIYSSSQDETKEEVVEKRKLPLAEEKELYKEALQLFQKKKYSQSITHFESLRERYPEGSYNEETAFLSAESYFLIADKTNEEKDILAAISAYKEVTRNFPDSPRNALAYYKIGKAYLMLDFSIEAKVSFDTVLDKYKGSNYEQGARFALVQMALEGKRFRDAYNEFLRGTAIAPKSVASRRATYMLANALFEHKDYIVSQRLYEQAMKKWPEHTDLEPEIMFGIGTSFLKNKNFSKGRKILFAMINLYPDSNIAENALLMLGEYYFKSGDEKNSLKIYVESLARKPETDQAILSKLKMANIGIVKPGIQMKNKIFDYEPYVDPLKTVEEIAYISDSPLAGEALFRKGEIYFKENNYLRAVLTLKNMISRYPDSPFAKKGVLYLKDIMFKLIDAYYDQNGFLPILNLYHSNADPFLKNITQANILYKIGESYQKVGFYEIAEKNYTKLGEFDKTGYYKKNIMTNMIKIAVAKGNYNQAEKTMKKFFSTYGAKKAPFDLIRLYVLALYKQNKFKPALKAALDVFKQYKTITARAELYYYIGSSYYKLNQFTRASNYFKKAITAYSRKKKKEATDYRMESYYYNADSFYKAGKYQSAIQAVEAALTKYPDNEWLLYLKGKSYEKIKNEDKAVTVLTEVTSGKNDILSSIAELDINYLKWVNENREVLDF